MLAALAAAITLAQQHTIITINQQVNASYPHSAPNGNGNCVPIAIEKARRLIAEAHISASALHTRIVLAPHGWSQPYHMLLDVDVTVNGHPWKRALDMNDPLPEQPRQEEDWGYRPLPPALQPPVNSRVR